jgi:hypothetical protein
VRERDRAPAVADLGECEPLLGLDVVLVRQTGLKDEDQEIVRELPVREGEIVSAPLKPAASSAACSRVAVGVMCTICSSRFPRKRTLSPGSLMTARETDVQMMAGTKGTNQSHDGPRRLFRVLSP